jgi:hypothetical protein
MGSNAFTEAFAKARATKAQIEQNREDKNHLIAGAVQELVEALNRVGLAINFTDNAALGEKGRVRSLKSTDECDTYYGRLVPFGIEGEEGELWADHATIPDYAPHVLVFLAHDGICYAEFSGGFIRTAVGGDRIFGVKKKLSVPPLTYKTGGYASLDTGTSPVTMEQLARCFAARYAGLNDVEGELNGILNYGK